MLLNDLLAEKIQALPFSFDSALEHSVRASTIGNMSSVVMEKDLIRNVIE